MHGEMQKFCFLNVFNSLSAEQILALEMAWAHTKGHVPGRKAMAALSKRIRLSQPRIRKWFTDKAVEGGGEDAEAAVGVPSTGLHLVDQNDRVPEGTISGLEHLVYIIASRLSSMRQQLQQIEHTVCQLQNVLSEL